MLHKNSCTNIAVVLLVSLLVSGTAVAQSITNYTFVPSSGTFTPLVGANIPALSGGSLDDGYYNDLPIGFTFNYLGDGYTTISATTNGCAVLGQTLTSSLITNNLTSGTPRPVFGPLWDDLDQETFGTFSYKTEGTAPNRVFTAEWLNFAWNYSATTPVISFQLKLYEADGTIAFIYREESGAIAGTPTASIGISAVGTGAGNFLSLDGTGPNPNVSSTIETTTLSTKPVSGQIYSFVTYPFPAISHTPLDNTTSTDARLVSAVITSSVGLAGAPNQPRMYYRIGTSGAYTAVVMTQTLADTWTATIPGQSAGTTVQYYIAAQDTSTPPLVMTAPSGGSGVNPPGSTPPLTPYQYFIIAPLVGGTVYPINGVQNPPVSFSDITNALTYIQACGITGTGQVILELSTGYAGEPAYPVTFLAFPGASATLGVVIRPAVGTSPFTLEGSSGTAIFYLDGVNYLTIDGRPGGTGTSKNIIVSNTSTSAAALRLINGATYNSINYCIFKGVNTSTGGVVYISAGASNKYNLIENCDITAGATFPAYGFYFYGISSDYNKYNIISKCRVYDFSSSGFYFYWYDSSTTIQECDIFTATQQTSTALYGINITGASATYGTKILSNKIHGFNTSGASPTFYGINIQTASPTVAHTIVNNMVSFDEAIVNPTATIYGIREYYSTVGTLYNIYYNTIYIGGTDVTSGFSYGMYRGYQSTSNFNNNIVFNNRTNSTGTGKHYCFYGGNAGTGLVSNNNDFYAPNANGYVGYWTSDRQTLNDWRTATNQDANSVSQNPNFISPSTSPPNLHINAAIATRLESGGIPIAGITTDIDGDVRAGSSKVHNNVQPDIGADEFNGTAIDEVPPVITYVQLDNTPFTTNRTLVARITDFVSGLANDPSRAPRLFYKKGNAGNWLIDTVLTSSGNNWIFTVNHTKLGGVVVGDTVFYFVQATDSSNNTGYNPVGGSTAPYSYQIVMSMSGNYNIGIGQTYPTLRAFFTALNNSAIIGNITGIVTSDITETVSDTLYPLNYFGGVWQVTIQPVAEKTVYTISGALAYPLICLNGADNITFNGMGKNLVFRNTSTSGRIFDFVNDATYNTITSCIIEGCGSSTTYPTIRFTTSTGTLGNSNNIISNNDIRDVSTTGNQNAIFGKF